MKLPWKIIGPACFWVSITTGLAIFFGDSFWTWTNRVFELSFILYVLAVIYALYFFIPRFGALLGTSIMTGIQSFFTQSKMSSLSQKGVEARQQKAEQNAQLEMVAAVDPLKGALVPLVEDMINNSESLPKAVRGMLAKNAATLISSSNVNFTGWVLQALDQKFPQLQLSAKLNALGVISNAEKVVQ